MFDRNIQSGPKVGIQYIVSYCIPTFDPLCICANINIRFCVLIDEIHPEDDQDSGRNTSKIFNKRKLKGVYLCLAFYFKCSCMKLISMEFCVKKVYTRGGLGGGGRPVERGHRRD